ncbi:MAG: hypothetical protein CL674_14390 [Bdellovibrionaceae bacterium]|jgi:hypothetical protein|nr:hypothetical protein [Pseudobdellovibrionaceae bacterium]MAF92456.1 hypothetical protein [Pseudobdellovibrionaceae bacterium]QDP47599.1 MAG: hypothetical protein GOVbin1174_47 [Prokaryotic dsDNA virus sp.]|tara:strand:+ start:4668 stop:4961 length:294 start_codon:yes stop_codon:yes gene_type:complete
MSEGKAREYKNQKVAIEVFYCDKDFAPFYKDLEEARRDCLFVAAMVNLSDYLDLQKENEKLKRDKEFLIGWHLETCFDEIGDCEVCAEFGLTKGDYE